jgi:transposase-like protein
MPAHDLVSGEDYPSTWSQFLEWFPDQTRCLAYLERLRWRDGFECPACGTRGEPYRTTRNRLTCRECMHEASVTAGTIFHRTRTPLPVWFAAVWYITSQKHGMSALGLQRILGFGSYQTAWAMLHKLRRAMVRPGRDRLSGTVEVDEIYVGGEETGVRGRETEKKAVVAVAVELRKPRGFGSIRLKRIDNAAAASLMPFIEEAVLPGSVVCTDGWGAYCGLVEHGYHHFLKNQSRSKDPAHVLLPGPHRVSSLLKRWLLGTHQGAVGMSHLDYYLDEFTFRFNRRSSRSRGLLFYRLLEQTVGEPPAPYKQLISPEKTL